MRTRQQKRQSRSEGSNEVVPRNPSALLQCFEHLDDDAWAEVLLPKLVEGGSAKNLALTCSDLRQMVQRNWRKLNFSILSVFAPRRTQTEKWTAAVPERFPACNAVKLRLNATPSYLVAQELMPALSKLPQLNHLIISNPPHPSPTAMAMQLANVRTQLPRVRRLTLVAQQDWMSATAAWQQLGGITQLTEVELRFTTEFNKAFQLADIMELSSLRSLQRLSVSANRVCNQQQHSGLEFVGRLSALTALDLVLPTAKGLSTVSRCRRLQRLVVQAVPHAEYRLKATLTRAVAQLTQLTQLHLGYKLLPDAQPVLYASLQKLEHLQYVAAVYWTPAVLPVVANLTSLQCIQGAWQDTEGASSSDSSYIGLCPHVRQLWQVWGPVPFIAFPGLERCTYEGAFTPSALKALHQHCPSLESLTVVGRTTQQVMLKDAPEWTSLPIGAALVDRVAVVRSLAQLPMLQELAWHAQDNAEVVGLASGGSALTSLTLLVPEGSTVAVDSLVQLGRLQRLQRVEFHLLDLLTTSEAAMLLCGMSHVSSVCIAGPSDVVDGADAGCTWALAAGLPVPKLVLKEYPSDHTSSEDSSSEELSSSDDDSMSESDDDD